MTSEGLNSCIWKGEILRYFLCATSALKIFLAKQTPFSCAVLFCAYSLAYVMQTCSNLICIVLWSEFLVCILKQECQQYFSVKIIDCYS